MVDLFLPPTKEQIEQARKLYGDPLFYWATNTAVKALNRMVEEQKMKEGIIFDFKKSQLGEWKFLTRRLLWEFGAGKVTDMVLELNTQNADEYWANWTPPEIKEEHEEISIDPTAQAISGKIKISDIARKYGLKKGKKLWLCPFHDDKNPSLSLSDSKGVFYCFACQSKGDIVGFVQMLEDLKKNA